MEQSPGFLGRFTMRERVLLVVMIFIFAILGFVTFWVKYNASLEDLEDEINSMQMAINLLTNEGQGFAERIRENEAVENQIQSNAVQLQGFLERHCQLSGVEPPSSYSASESPLRNGLDEFTTVATINNVEALPLNRLLQRIENDPELVLIQVVDIRRMQRRDEYRVQLTLSTYRESEQR